MIRSPIHPVMRPLARAVMGPQSAANADPILALFSGGEQGAYYDPSDSSTVFQDAAMTTPAGANDPVGALMDKSGNGNHATQSMAAARPIRRTDGTHWWLEFDGVDDAMATFAIDFTATDKVSTGLAIRTLTSSPGVLLEISPNTGANFGAFYVVQNDGAPYTSASHGTGAFGSANVARFFGDAAINTTNVVTSQHDLGANLTTIRRNAVDGTPATNALGGNFGNYALNFGARNGGAAAISKALIYRAFVRGALTQSADLTAIETELAAAAGIAL